MEASEKIVFTKGLRIGNKYASVPIVQGGMGVGISRSSLAGAVAKEGGVGIISSAQIGYDEEGFEKDQNGCNLLAIRKHIQKAKEIAGGNGLVGINVMVALKHYREHIKEAVAAGADLVVCGAGLPTDIPEFIDEKSGTKMAPIVSSLRAAKIILKMWDKKYQRTADLIVVEGPKAGGHLGFNMEQLSDIEHIDFDKEVKDIIQHKKIYEAKYNKSIPVVVGGGIYDNQDIGHILSLGADGVQIASRFVATYECDAADAYKQAYIHASKEDIQIVQSPVGMPGRALRNEFIKQIEKQKETITKCYNCLAKCNPAEVSYCITKALTEAVKGNVENGLIFCGANIDRIDRLYTVHELIQELIYGYSSEKLVVCPQK